MRPETAARKVALATEPRSRLGYTYAPHRRRPDPDHRFLRRRPRAGATRRGGAVRPGRDRDRLHHAVEIEAGGWTPCATYAERLDGWTGGADFEITPEQVEQLTAPLPADLKAALDAGAERTYRFASMQRAHLHDFAEEVVPGVVCGQKYVPVGRRRLPPGRPLPADGQRLHDRRVPKTAGVDTVLACTPPQPGGGAHPAMLYTADRLRRRPRVLPRRGAGARGDGVRLLEGEPPVDMIVGAGNAYVAEAKRQLFGRVGIDLLAGPSEVAVIADETADPEWWPPTCSARPSTARTRPPCLVTTSAALGGA